MSQPIGCVVLVIKKNKILLGKRINSYATGTYGMPGGRVEVGEKLVDCAERELKEETGLIAENIEYVGVVKEHQDDYDFIHFVFKCERWQGEPRTMEPQKCEGWEWFDLNELPAPILPGHAYAPELLANPHSQLIDR